MHIERVERTGSVTLAAALLLAIAGVSTGCAKAQAAVEPEMPALAVPPPPPRVLPPLEGQPIEAATTAPSEPQARPRAPRTRSETARGVGNGTSKPETRADAAVATAAPSESPVAEAETLAPPPAIQLAPAGDAVSEQNTRGRLVQAERDLQRVDYQRLNSDAKVQYDTAKRFIVLAQQAITDRNLLFAHTLADKAATIAAVLQRR
jgi:hypothetical protein